MTPRRLGRALVLTAVVSANLAGCASHVQVRRSDAGSNVRIRFSHPEAGRDDQYADSVVVDGTPIELGAPQGGTLHLRLPPGRHELTFESAVMAQELGFVTRTNPQGQCIGAACVYLLPEKTESLEFVWKPRPLCAQTVVLDLGEGETVDATFSVQDGTCQADGV